MPVFGLFTATVSNTSTEVSHIFYNKNNNNNNKNNNKKKNHNNNNKNKKNNNNTPFIYMHFPYKKKFQNFQGCSTFSAFSLLDIELCAMQSPTNPGILLNILFDLL